VNKDYKQHTSTDLHATRGQAGTQAHKHKRTQAHKRTSTHPNFTADVWYLRGDLCAGHDAVTQDDVAADALALDLVREPHHRRLGHELRARHQRRLDLRRACRSSVGTVCKGRKAKFRQRCKRSCAKNEVRQAHILLMYSDHISAPILWPEGLMTSSTRPVIQ